MRASWRRFAMSWAVIPNLCNLSRLAFGKHDGLMALMENEKNDGTSGEVCALRRVLLHLFFLLMCNTLPTYFAMQSLKCNRCSAVYTFALCSVMHSRIGAWRPVCICHAAVVHCVCLFVCLFVVWVALSCIDHDIVILSDCCCLVAWAGWKSKKLASVSDLNWGDN